MLCIASGFFILFFMVILFTALQFYKLYCDNTTIFNKQTCMVVHKYINVPYEVEIDVFFLCGSTIFLFSSFIFVCLFT